MRKFLIVAPSLLLSGCAVGPNFHRPEPPTIAQLTPNPLPATTGQSIADRQTFKVGAMVSSRWWTAFGSIALDTLEDEALRHNPDVASATAALRAARQTYLAQRGNLFPTVTANAQAQREKNAGVLQSPLNDNADIFNLYTASLNASYTLDVFGGVRRSVEGARAQAEQQRFQTEAAYLTVTTNVANTAITLASIKRQITIVGRIIVVDRQFLDIVLDQQRLGAASGADVAAARLALAQAQAALPPLAKQGAQAQDFLATLVGRYPADHFEAPDLADLRLPAELPVSLPSALVDQRPDIRAAEANLHNASAQVGVAIAARLPDFSLTPTVGGTSTTLSTLFSNGNLFWTLAGNLLQPVFDGGTLAHRQHAAEALLAQAKAQYRSTVLSAMQNVADVLQSVSADADGLGTANSADEAARRAFDIARDQARLGQISGAATLTLQTAWLQTEQNLVQAQAQRLSDSVLLFQALGGGWSNGMPMEQPLEQLVSRR